MTRWRIASIVVVCVLSMWLAMSVWTARHEVHLHQVENALKMAIIGLQNYRTAQGQFPPLSGAAPGNDNVVSWRLLCTPYIEKGAGLHSYSPGERHPIFCVGAPRSSNLATLYAVSEKNSLLSAEGRQTPIEDIPAQLLVLVYVPEGWCDWQLPGDICGVPATDDCILWDEAKERCPGPTLLLAFMDGEVWHVRKEVPVATLQALSRVDTSKTQDRQAALNEFVIERR